MSWTEFDSFGLTAIAGGTFTVNDGQPLPCCSLPTSKFLSPTLIRTSPEAMAYLGLL
jgi:hypothetical protein